MPSKPKRRPLEQARLDVMRRSPRHVAILLPLPCCYCGCFLFLIDSHPPTKIKNPNIPYNKVCASRTSRSCSNHPNGKSHTLPRSRRYRKDSRPPARVRSPLFGSTRRVLRLVGREPCNSARGGGPRASVCTISVVGVVCSQSVMHSRMIIILVHAGANNAR